MEIRIGVWVRFRVRAAQQHPRVGSHRCIEAELGQAGLPAAAGGGDGVDGDDGLARVGLC